MKLRLSEGRTYWRIAEELGRSQRSVDSRVERGGEPEHGRCAWSTEDVALLRTLFIQGIPIAQIARDMRRTYQNVWVRLSRMDVQLKGGTVRHWSDEDLHAIEKYYKAGCSDKVIAKRLSFQPSPRAVKQKRVRMGLKTWKFATKYAPWSEPEVDKLRDMAAQQLSVAQISARLPNQRTRMATFAKLNDLGIKYIDSRPARWTNADVSLLRTLHSRGLSVEAIRDALSAPRTLPAVRTKMWNMKLYFSKGREDTEPTKNEDTTEDNLVTAAS